MPERDPRDKVMGIVLCPIRRAGSRIIRLEEAVGKARRRPLVLGRVALLGPMCPAGVANLGRLLDVRRGYERRQWFDAQAVAIAAREG